MADRRTLPPWLEAAETYVQLGWYVVPLSGTDEVRRSTEHSVPPPVTRADLRRWAGRAAPVALGLALGGPAGLAALTVDRRAGAAARLQALEERHAPLPATLRFGGGGRTTYLFTTAAPLPPETTLGTDGLTLHGAGSVLRLPGTILYGRRVPGDVTWRGIVGEEHPTPLPAWLEQEAARPTDGDPPSVAAQNAAQNAPRRAPRGGDHSADDASTGGDASPASAYQAPPSAHSVPSDQRGPGSDGAACGPGPSRVVEALPELAIESPPAPRRSGHDQGAAPTPHRAPAAVPLPFEDARTAQTETAWLLRRWLPAGSTSLLVGPPKVAGKTTWLLGLARAVLRGQPYLGQPTTDGPVVFLTAQHAAAFDHMIHAMDLRADDAHALHVLHRSRVPSLSWTELVDGCLAQCRRAGARLLVVDGLEQVADRPLDPDGEGHGAALRELVAGLPPDVTLIVSASETGPAASLQEALQRIGPAASRMDTVFRLTYPDEQHPRLRRLDSASCYADVPVQTWLTYARGGVHLRGADVPPLFADLDEEHRPSALA